MPGLTVRSETPFNAETPPGRLGAAFVTQQADFYVRCHGDVPVLAEDAHRLTIQGRVKHALDLSMGDLRDRFTAHTVLAVMQCAGNRRADLHRLRPVMGGCMDRWRDW